MTRIVPVSQIAQGGVGHAGPPQPCDQKPQDPPGLHIGTLEAGDELTVRTCNSTYRLVVLGPSEGTILIRGGRFFSRSVEATLLGSSSPQETHEGRIATGFSLEVLVDESGYKTSPVEAIEWESRPR